MSMMSVHVLLNLLNELEKRDDMRRLSRNSGIIMKTFNHVYMSTKRHF